MITASPKVQQARELLDSTRHARSTKAAAIDYLEDGRLSLREVAKRHRVHAANVMRALRRIPGVSTAQKRKASGANTPEAFGDDRPPLPKGGYRRES